MATTDEIEKLTESMTDEMIAQLAGSQEARDASDKEWDDMTIIQQIAHMARNMQRGSGEGHYGFTDSQGNMSELICDEGVAVTLRFDKDKNVLDDDGNPVLRLDGLEGDDLKRHITTIRQRNLIAQKCMSTHFRHAAEAWGRTAAALKACLTVSDDALLIERPATTFILAWMRERRVFETTFSSLFGRKKLPPLADDFTAAVALSLEQFLATRGFVGRVRSEETTHKKRGASRPDISVLSAEGRLLATIECKTNLGWKRAEWKEQCEARNSALVSRFPKCVSFLCVLTQKNWDSKVFLESEYCGKQWFCLSKVAVGKIADPVGDILHPIEPLFLSILKLLAT